jgi:outer membrane lipoprotein-sorting protein
MNKPKFLYHGSRYKVEILRPQQAYGSPDEKGDEYGIYAYENKNMAVPFSLTIKPFENGSMAIYVDDDTSHVTISVGTIDDNAIGYIYKVSSKSFEKLDERQWLSKEEVTPIEMTVVNTKDYMHKITFTGAAEEYRKKNQQQ